jgi:hypothetical protein
MSVRNETLRRAALAELERVVRDHARERRQIERENDNPNVLICGLVVVLVLFEVSWLMLDRMRCDPFYSDIPLSRPYACR